MKQKNIRFQIADEPLRRPWAARVDFLLQADNSFGIDGEICLLERSDVLVQVGPVQDLSLEQYPHLKRYRARVEGFVSPSEAEAAGMLLSLSILWSAISHKYSLRLDYHTPLPTIVYDRTMKIKGGISAIGDFSITRQVPPEIGGLLLEELPRSPDQVDRLTLLSMELFVAARLEMSDRSRFISLISALEPLANPQDYPDSVKNLITELKAHVRGVSLEGVSKEHTAKIKNSLEGRISELEHESVRQALLRTVRDLLPADQVALQKIDAAYALRSKILHEGITDPYLDRQIIEVEDIMRRLYAAKIGRELAVPANS